MKKFILKLSLLFGLLIVADIAFGTIFKLYDYTKSGEIAKINSIMTKETPDLLIMGSSRAAHHYDPKIFIDALNIETFNAGIDGKGASDAYGFFKGLDRRGYPKAIILEISPKFDLFKEDSQVTMNNFYPYIDIEGISDMIIDFDPIEYFKLKSNLYRLNSDLLRLLPSIFIKREPYSNGYVPLFGVFKGNKQYKPQKQQNIDPIKEKYLHKLIDEATSNECNLFLAVSPIYGGVQDPSYEYEISLLEKYNLPILNHLNDERLIRNPDYFQDLTHLNHTGASVYSNIILEEVIHIMDNNPSFGFVDNSK